MMCRSMKVMLCRRGPSRSSYFVLKERFYSNGAESRVEKKTEQLFFMDDVQDLLKKLTRLDLDKVYKIKKEGVKFQAPQYRFMTTQQYEKVLDKAVKKANEFLQMPPAMDEREEINRVFVKDDNLIGYSQSKFVFTDITYGVNDRLRDIVVRDEDGTLREAKWEERDRMNQIYFPRPARHVTPPKLFNEQNLQSLLERGEYLFILDSACCQFEPDDPMYIRVCHDTYRAVDRESAYNILRSTRHFGPLVFYLTRNQMIDNLLMENIATDRIEDACWLISLYYILNPESKSSMKTLTEGKQIEFIQNFISSDSKSKDKLDLTLQTYKEYLKS